MKKDVLVVTILIISMAILRVVNAEFHLYNLVPMAALGLLGGATLQNKKWAYLVPLSSMLLSDLGLELFTKTPGFYGISQVVNYVALALVTFMGTKMANKKASSIIGYTLGSSVLFFVLSNFGTFLQGYYGFSFQGLVNCYIAAIPFFKNEFATTIFLNSFIGDMLFSLLGFSAYALASKKLAMA